MTTEKIRSHHDEAIAMAAADFNDHAVTRLSALGDYSQVWRCGREASSLYSFFVTCHSSRLFVNGDIGDITLWRPKTEMVSWARSAVSSPAYLFSKAQPFIDKVWSDFYFHAWIKESEFITVPEIHDVQRDVRNHSDGEERALSDWLGYAHPEVDACEEIEACLDFSVRHYYILEAVKVFLKLLDGDRS